MNEEEGFTITEQYDRIKFWFIIFICGMVAGIIFPLFLNLRDSELNKTNSSTSFKKSFL